MSESPADPAPLAQETLNAIAATGVVRKYPKNAVLINEGDQSDTLFIILSGKVKVYASNEAGKEVVIDFHGPGEYVGEMMLDGAPRSASVVTVDNTELAKAESGLTCMSLLFETAPSGHGSVSS